MFTTEYVKNLYDNYMVLTVEGEESREANFAYKMLVGNNIKGLLKCKKRVADRNNCYYYDISSGQAVANTFEKGQLDEYQIKGLIDSILMAVDEARKYMLRDDGFVLRPEYTFINITSFEVNLCYLPGAGTDLKEELSEFLEFILERVDHNNDKAIVLSYGLYQIVKSNEVSFEKLTRFMDNTMKDPGCGQGTFVKEETIIRRNQEDECEEDVNVEYIDSMVNDEYDMHNGQGFNKRLFELNERYERLIPVALYISGLLAAAGIIYISGLCIKNGKLNVLLWIVLSFTVGSGLAALMIYCVKTRFLIKKENPVIESDDKELIYNEYHETEYSKDGHHESDDFELNVNYEDDENIEEKTILLSDLRQTGFALKRTDKDVKTVKISGYPFVVGKVEGKVDLCLKEVAVSRFHAKIEEYGDSIKITDLNSTNGTFVDEQRITPDEPFPVSTGQRIRFGNIEYILISIVV